VANCVLIDNLMNLCLLFYSSIMTHRPLYEVAHKKCYKMRYVNRTVLESFSLDFLLRLVVVSNT